MVVTKDTIIDEILKADQDTAPYFLEIGMHCLGCPASRGETLEQACDVHGTDVDDLVEKLKGNPSYIFTLIQKFNKPDEPPIYPDHDILIMSDEAHQRDQHSLEKKGRLE